MDELNVMPFRNTETQKLGKRGKKVKNAGGRGTECRLSTVANTITQIVGELVKSTLHLKN